MSGKTLVTSEGTKIVPVPKAQVIKSTGANTTWGTGTSTTSPWYTITKVVPGSKSPNRVKWEDQEVSGMNTHGPSENTHSQTRERSTGSTRTSASGYNRLVVDEIDTMDSDLESEEVQAISDDESLAPEDPSEPGLETEQWLSIPPKENRPFPKAYSPHRYYRDVTSGTFCHNCRNCHPTGETIEQVVVGSEVTSTFPIKIQGTSCAALIDTGATKSLMSETIFNSQAQAEH